MPREGWGTVNLPDTFLEKINRELEKDRDFKSISSLIIHVVRMHLEKDDREKLITKAWWNTQLIDKLIRITG